MEQILGSIDGQILIWIQENLRSSFLDPFWILITKLGNGGIIWIVLTLAFLVPKKTRKTAEIAAIALVLSLLVNNLLLKNIVQRERPFDAMQALIPLVSRPTDFSFPSGHTAASFAAGWTYFRNLPGKYGVPLLVLAVCIALSRLYVGVHYPTDVLVGAVDGIFLSLLAQSLLSCLTAYREIQK